MQMRSINDTIRNTLMERGQGSYLSYAEPVVEALVQREQEMYSQLLAEGVSLGASPRDVEGVLNEVGMTRPPAHVTPVQTSPESTEQPEQEQPVSDGTPAGEALSNLLTGIQNLLDEVASKFRR